RLEQHREPLFALGVVVPGQRMESGQRRVRDQLDAASSTRPARRRGPSASAAAAPARQSGRRSGIGGIGGLGSSVAMLRYILRASASCEPLPWPSMASGLPYCTSSDAAVLAPTPRAPGILSDGSPRSAMKSGTWVGSTP